MSAYTLLQLIEVAFTSAVLLFGVLTHSPSLTVLGGGFLIGWAKPVPVNVRQLHHPRRDYMLVAAAGPASNLAIAFVAAIVLLAVPVSPQTLDETNVSVPIATMLGQLMRLNVLLAVFNMIPIPPLDGGNVLSGLLPVSLARFYDRLRRQGNVIAHTERPSMAAR